MGQTACITRIDWPLNRPDEPVNKQEDDHHYDDVNYDMMYEEVDATQFVNNVPVGASSSTSQMSDTSYEEPVRNFDIYYVDMSGLISISEVNRMPYEQFISIFGNVVEHCSLCAAAVWRQRPFSDVSHLHEAMSTFLDQQPLAGKEGVLRLHPDLAGKLAQSGGLTSDSTKEQTSAGLFDLADKERQLMNKLNEEYREKFGFPFVICARENKKEAILKGLETRLKNSSEEEALTGVAEVKKICRLRLLDIVDPSSSTKSAL